jgi:hypothetical protein
LAKEKEEGKEDEGTDSPIELLKDIFMHLIQEEKHNYYQPDDWFQLNTAIHQFLTKASGAEQERATAL